MASSIATDVDLARRSTWLRVVVVAIAAAWLVAVVAQSTGDAGLLHHDALIEGGGPFWLALLAFLLAWQVMVVAMMLPASIPALRVFAAGSAERRGPARAWLAFLGTYLAVWSGFGALAFVGDFVLHRTVDANLLLTANAWLISATLLAAAGAYQFAPWKRRSLAACRHPSLTELSSRAGSSPGRMGFRHALDCLGSSGALMLVMFAAGFANLWWMAAIAVAMAYETTGRHGRTVASIAGGCLLFLAVLVVSSSSRVI
jgi:predicted metal-binding membrane protein